MALKKKIVTHRYEGEYESPDGEIYDFAAVHSGDRSYIQWRLQTEDQNAQWITIDGEMLSGLYECYLDMTGKKAVQTMQYPPGVRSSGKGLRKPNITDHREPKGVAIHSQVRETMSNYDDSQVPIESFSPPKQHVWDGMRGTAEMRAGVDPMLATEEPPDTPEQWRLDGGTSWKQDAEDRKNMPKPQYKAKGPVGERVRRVGAGDII